MKTLIPHLKYVPDSTSTSGRGYPWLNRDVALNFALVVLALTIAALLLVVPHSTSVVSLDVESVESGRLQVFFDQGAGFSEELSVTRDYVAGRQVLRFQVPVGDSLQLRIDPQPMSRELIIRGAEAFDAGSASSRPLPLGGLSPLHQISTIELLGASSLRLIMAEQAEDPQLTLSLEQAVTSDAGMQNWRLLLWQTLLASLLILAFRTIDPSRISSTHFCVAAFALVSVMAVLSPLVPSPHPDEFLHVADAAYFGKHWLPPQLGDGTLAPSYTNNVYGVSYLYEWNVTYWFAGVIGNLLSSLSIDPLLSYRIFNVLLMGLAAISILWAGLPRSALAVLFLTPQLWYVFSYFNGDAFPFTMGCVVVALALARRGSVQRFIMDGIRPNLRLAAFAIALGLLLISKKNYLPVAAFTSLWLFASCLRLSASATSAAVAALMVVVFAAAGGVSLLDEFGLRSLALVAVVAIVSAYYALRWLYDTFVRTSEYRPALIRLLALHLVALAVASPWIAVDVYRNGAGATKSETVQQLREQHAAYPFKPSTIASVPSQSQPGLSLASKGVGLKEILLPPHDWIRGSFRSFFSAYGYMKYFASGWIYLSMALLMAVLLAIGALAGLRSGALGIRHLVLTIGCAGLTVGAAALHSWTYDFQPQGRYVLCVLPMFIPLLAALPVGGGMGKSCGFMLLIAFGLSAYSFLFIGLANLT